VSGRLGLLLFLLGAGSAGLKASSVICQTGPSLSSLVTASCGQTFNANEFMNWGAPTSSGGLAEATTGRYQVDNVTAQNLNGTESNDSIVVSSPLSSGALLEREDNTVYGWDSTNNSWQIPSSFMYETIHTFAGNFNAPSYPTSTAPYGPNNYPYQFGDPLLGDVPSAGSSATTNPTVTMKFADSLYGIAFEVSSASAQNFIATLDAYDVSGNLIGVYQVNSTGTGGTCAGLSTLSPNPTPCNDAATIEFYDPQGRIKSVALTVNDTSGLFIDTLELATISTPEPDTAPLIGIGLIVLAMVAKRTSVWRRGPKEISKPEEQAGLQSRSNL
jgi:hypothetical protein